MHSPVEVDGVKVWREDAYGGYGIFGGKDYYVLLAEINFGLQDTFKKLNEDDRRSLGIELFFEKKVAGVYWMPKDILYPVLTESDTWTGGFTVPNETHEGQGQWFEEPEEEMFDMGYEHSEGFFKRQMEEWRQKIAQEDAAQAKKKRKAAEKKGEPFHKKTRFRAETLSDVLGLLQLPDGDSAKMFQNMRQITITPATIDGAPGNLPDVDVELETKMSLEGVREMMRKVRDGHVMVQSLNYAEDYTGERNYDQE